MLECSLEFFHPLSPVDICILRDDRGRPSGEADVYFATHNDASQAMNKDRANIRKDWWITCLNLINCLTEHRYIELFLESDAAPPPQPVPPPPMEPPYMNGPCHDDPYPPPGTRLNGDAPALFRGRRHMIHMRGLPYRATENDIAGKTCSVVEWNSSSSRSQNFSDHCARLTFGSCTTTEAARQVKPMSSLHRTMTRSER